MNVQYRKLGNGQWMVEAWVWTAPHIMLHTTAFHKERRIASLDAIATLCGKMGVL